jgi:hypothetical protein
MTTYQADAEPATSQATNTIRKRTKATASRGFDAAQRPRKAHCERGLPRPDATNQSLSLMPNSVACARR